MKITKRLISIVCSLALVLSTAAIVMTTTASAEEDTTAYKFTSLYRNYDYNEWPQKIEYTSGGYVTYKDEGRFLQQRLVNWVLSPDTAGMQKLIDTIVLANSDYQEMLAMDVNTIDCWGSNFLEPQQGGFEVNIMINFKYKDPDNVDAEDNPEGWTYAKFGAQGYYPKLGQNVTVRIPVDDYAMYSKDYEGFTFTSVQMHVMGYANNAFKPAAELSDEYKQYAGQKGVGNFNVQFSPFYIYGTTAPKKGTDLGEDVSFTPNAEDPTMGAGTFVIGGKEYPQQPLPEGATKKADGKYGNGRGIDWENVKPSSLLGDVNFDGKVNAIDLLMIKKYIVNIGTVDTTIADVNSDTKVNALDLLIIKKYIVKIDAGPWGAYQ